MKQQGVFLRQMAADATEAVIDIVGVIGWEVGYTQLKTVLAALPETCSRVVFDIYSPGGDVWDGNGIIQTIGELSKTRETVARIQVAASMATLIAVACKQRSIAANGRFLIHNAWTVTQGDADEHEKRAKELRDTEMEAAAFYAQRTGGAPEDMLALMDEERWLTPQETLDLGFVQSIEDPFAVEDYAAVRAEIEAAGRWPQALAELPKGETDDHADTAGSEGGADGVADNEDASATADAQQAQADEWRAHYERGFADGRNDGYAAALADVRAESDQLKATTAQAVADARKHQSERDKAAAQLAASEKAAEHRAAILQGQIDALTAQLQQFVSGSLTFHAEAQTWDQALAECGGDYAKAARTYPALLSQYRAAQRQKGQRQ